MLPTCRGIARRRRGLLVRHLTMPIDTTRTLEFVDLTPAIAATVWEYRLTDGTVWVQTRHTTTGLLINEDEPLLLEDLSALFDRLAPQHASYAHDDFTRRVPDLGPAERRNGAAHCRAALLRTSESIGVSGGVLTLGRWQRLFLVEFDGGQPRQLSVTLIGLVSRRRPGEVLR